MPETMHEVEELIALCVESGVGMPTLLVVPGLDWNRSQLHQLRRWHGEECELAGHGWQHRCPRIRTLYHRLHSLLLSRDVAEHLSYGGDEVLALMRRCADWFVEQDFDLPQLYVPPAWALGNVDATRLTEQPFRLVETLRGVFNVRQRHLKALPLVGFEADNWFRQVFLSGFNRLQASKATLEVPLRIGIHPFDHRLRLRRQLAEFLTRPWESVRYATLESDCGDSEFVTSS